MKKAVHVLALVLVSFCIAMGEEVEMAEVHHHKSHRVVAHRS